MVVRYEWDRETVDQHGDIQDHDHRDRMREFQEPIGPDQRLVLVRDVFDEADHLIRRDRAYVDEGKLPDRFDGGAQVPERFKKELAG